MLFPIDFSMGTRGRFVRIKRYRVIYRQGEFHIRVTLLDRVHHQPYASVEEAVDAIRFYEGNRFGYIPECKIPKTPL